MVFPLTLTELLELWPYIRVAHHIPGRLRLKAAGNILSQPSVHKITGYFLANNKTELEEAKFAAKKLLQEKGIINIIPNALALSVVIEYDVRRLAPSLLTTFFASNDMDEVTQLAKQVADTLNIELQP